MGALLLHCVVVVIIVALTQKNELSLLQVAVNLDGFLCADLVARGGVPLSGFYFLPVIVRQSAAPTPEHLIWHNGASVFDNFFDDDILYDSQAAGFTEEQNVIRTRILEETPRLKPQRNIQSVEGTINVYETTEEDQSPHTAFNLKYLTDGMGTSDQTSDYAPSWKSTFIQGEISGSVSSAITGSSTSCVRQIPQIDTTIEYTMEVANVNDNPPVQGQLTTPKAPVSTVYPDGTYIKLIEEQILCQLIEKSGFLFKDGLEVEVFLYQSDTEGDLKPLKFYPPSVQIKNGILLDETSADMDNEDDNLDPNYVEYYINFNTDRQIPDVDICRGIQTLKSQNVELSLDVECPDADGVFFDIYGTRVGEGDIIDCPDGEDC